MVVVDVVVCCHRTLFSFLFLFHFSKVSNCWADIEAQVSAVVWQPTVATSISSTAILCNCFNRFVRAHFVEHYWCILFPLNDALLSTNSQLAADGSATMSISWYSAPVLWCRFWSKSFQKCFTIGHVIHYWVNRLLDIRSGLLLDRWKTQSTQLWDNCRTLKWKWMHFYTTSVLSLCTTCCSR